MKLKVNKNNDDDQKKRKYNLKELRKTQVKSQRKIQLGKKI